jgi:WD40 repeat protein
VTAVDFGRVKGQPRIITGGNDATARIWDPHTSQQLGRSLAGHQDSITSVRIADIHGRATVVSSSEDSTVRLWDAETGEQLAMFVSDSPVHSCAVSPNGGMVVAGCRSGIIHFLSLEN